MLEKLRKKRRWPYRPMTYREAEAIVNWAFSDGVAFSRGEGSLETLPFPGGILAIAEAFAVYGTDLRSPDGMLEHLQNGVAMFAEITPESCRGEGLPVGPRSGAIDLKYAYAMVNLVILGRWFRVRATELMDRAILDLAEEEIEAIAARHHAMVNNVRLKIELIKAKREDHLGRLRAEEEEGYGASEIALETLKEIFDQRRR